jgi:DMSO/TMAO reductase YedYZ molybdopterin-dependent catalytic subunit
VEVGGFLARLQTDGVSDIHFVTTWSRFDNHWRGVAAKHLLSLIEPKRDAAYLIFKGYDDYVTNVPLK